MTKKVNVIIRLRKNGYLDVWKEEENRVVGHGNNKEISYSGYNVVVYDIENIKFYLDYVQIETKRFIEGENCTIFAYGQTGSGKTYTMMGNDNNGIIFMTLKDILEEKDVYLSFLEIYNEKIFDLYTNKELKMFTIENNTVISNLSSIFINSFDSAARFINICEKNRKYGTTDFNIKSSRSHAIFQIKYQNDGTVYTFNLIDLAGSERATKNDSRRMEGSFINKSLLALCTLINNIQKGSYIGFRESKLTRILQSSLNGETNLTAICMLSPYAECQDESVSTLNFAARLCDLEIKKVESKLDSLDFCAHCSISGQKYTDGGPVDNKSLIKIDTSIDDKQSLFNRNQNNTRCIHKNSYYKKQDTEVSKLYYGNHKKREEIKMNKKSENEIKVSLSKTDHARLIAEIVQEVPLIKILKLDMKQGCYSKLYKSYNQSLVSQMASSKNNDNIEDDLTGHEDDEVIKSENVIDRGEHEEKVISFDIEEIKNPPVSAEIIQKEACEEELNDVLNENNSSNKSEEPSLLQGKEICETSSSVNEENTNSSKCQDFQINQDVDVEEDESSDDSYDLGEKDTDSDDLETIYLSDELENSVKLNDFLKNIKQCKIDFDDLSKSNKSFTDELLKSIEILENRNQSYLSKLKTYKKECKRLKKVTTNLESLLDNSNNENFLDHTLNEKRLLDERVLSLEKMIQEMLKKNPNKRMNEIFLLEKYMFDLKREAIYNKKDSKELKDS